MHPLRLLCFCCLLLQGSHAATLTLALRHTVGGQPLQLNSLRYRNAHDELFAISRLSYLVANLALQDQQGQWHSIPDALAWMDAAARRTQLELSAPPQHSYQAIRFDIGLSAEVNHSDPAQYAAQHPLNPNLNQLHWTWQSGYIFLALEGRYRDNTGQLQGFVYHFANDPQRTTISLPLPQTIAAGSLIDIDFDIAALLNAPSSIAFTKHGASSHSRAGDPITTALKNNLRSAFQLRRIQTAPAATSEPPKVPIDLPSSYTAHGFQMSRRFPIPALPTDNPLIAERVELGRQLFHDPRLSADDSIACASCHQTEAALSDNRTKSIGISGQLSRRHSMPLFNLAWKQQFFWDGRAPSLREQVLMPIQDPREMGASLPGVLHKLCADSDYRMRFADAFESGAINATNLSLALESFLLSLTSYDSKFDQAMQGKAQLSAAEQRGFELFMTEYEPRSGQYGADCFHCHGGALFTDNRFHDNGLQADHDLGLGAITQRRRDAHHFATPSLRNVALTAPYMHDGRFETLEQVIEHYSSGIQRRATLDPNLSKHPAGGLQLSAADQAALLAFLKTLSDPQYGAN
jgi:cytochrome c peroxidase